MGFLLDWARVFLWSHARLLRKHPLAQNTASRLGSSTSYITSILLVVNNGARYL